VLPAPRLVNVKAKVRKRLGWALVAFSSIVGLWAFTQPLPYVYVAPGPAFNVLGEYEETEIISITPSPSGESLGSIDLLTVSQYGSPGLTPSFIELLVALFSEDKAIYPIEAIYPPGVSEQEMDAKQSKYFAESKQSAIAAAFAELPAGLSDEYKVTLELDKVGGPSGGLAFALGIIDKLSPESITGGKRFAVTGTISSDGAVGAIGGIRQKVYTAIASGDRFLIIPEANCEMAMGVNQSKVRIVPVASLNEALAAMATIATDGDLELVPVCSTK
jgi:PDZ domain-containing protein